MSEEDIELIAQGCGFDSKQKEAFRLLMQDLKITNLDDLYSKGIDLDRLTIRLYSKFKLHTIATVITLLRIKQMISKVLDKDGEIIVLDNDGKTIVPPGSNEDTIRLKEKLTSYVLTSLGSKLDNEVEIEI